MLIVVLILAIIITVFIYRKCKKGEDDDIHEEIFQEMTKEITTSDSDYKGPMEMPWRMI